VLFQIQTVHGIRSFTQTKLYSCGIVLSWHYIYFDTLVFQLFLNYDKFRFIFISVLVKCK